MNTHGHKFNSSTESPFALMMSLLGSGEFNYAYNISLVNNYVYIENAKAACTTLKSSFGSAELLQAGLGQGFANNYLKNVHANILGVPFVKPYQIGAHGFDELVSSNVIIFTFVKNPYTRLLSAYLDKVKRRLPDSEDIYRAANRQMTEEMPFEEFVEVLRAEVLAGHKVDKHFRPQFDQCGRGRIRIDLVGRVETFDEDFLYISQKCHIENNVSIDVRQHATGAEDLMDQFYTDSLAERVFNAFESDFHAFGYSANWKSTKSVAKKL